MRGGYIADMNVWAFVLLLAACICLGIEWARSGFQSLFPLGMCLMAGALLVEFVASTHTVSF